MDKEHDHIGPWWGIGAAIVVSFALLFTIIILQAEGLSSLGDRVDEVEQRIECVAPETLFFDPDGNRLEVFCEMMEPAEGKKWMGENSGVRRPLVLEEASS